MSRKVKKGAYTFLLYFILIIVCVIIIYPILWIVFKAFDTTQTMYSSTLIPEVFSLSNFKWLFDPEQSDFLLWFKNSMIISISTMVLQVILVSFTSYAYSRFKFKGKKLGLMSFMVLQVLPVTSAMMAYYSLGVLLGFVQNNPKIYLIAIYVGTSIPGNTYLVKGYFDNISRELDEAAYLDGASKFTTFFKIVLPLAKPILSVEALWGFTTPLQEFVIAKMILRGSENYTLAVGLQTLVASGSTGGTQSEYAKFAAGALMIALPIALLYIFLQKYLISGLTAGGTKG